MPRSAWLWFVLALAVNFLLVRYMVPGAESPLTIPYTLFKAEVSKGNVAAVDSRGDTITGRFKTAVTYPPAVEKGSQQKGGLGSVMLHAPPRSSTRFATTLPSF